MTSTPQPPSTPSSSSSGLSSVATPSTGSLLSKESDMSIYQRFSVTPDRTAANRYFDPARGGFTNGSSSSRSQSIQSPSCSTDQMRIKKVPKTHKTSRGLSGGEVEMESAPQSGAEKMHLPPVGSFSPPSKGNICKAPQAPAGGGRRPGNGKIGMQPVSNSRYPTQGGSTSSIPADRPYLMAGGLPAASSGGQKSGTGKRSTLRRTSSSLEPTLQPSMGGAFSGPEPETHDEPTRKKQKITPPGPRVYVNPYMNPIKFCAGTFTNPRRASRDPSIPEPSNPYTRRRYDELVASQAEESPDDLLAVEAAGQLMELQRRDYDKDFAQRMNSVPKRRRSN